MTHQKTNPLPSFETSIKKAMGKDWHGLTSEQRKTVREISRCQKGGGRPPLDAKKE